MPRIEDIKARLAAATPGPWEAHESPPGCWGVWKHVNIADLPDGGQVDKEIAQQGDDATLADAHLIANAPADLAWAVKILETAKKLALAAFELSENAEEDESQDPSREPEAVGVSFKDMADVRAEARLVMYLLGEPILA